MKDKILDVWDILNNINNQINSLNSERVKAGSDLLRMTDEYYTRKRQLTINDDISSLRSSDLRDAEVGTILEQEGLLRKYGEAKLVARVADRKWEALEIMSSNCRALLYAGNTKDALGKDKGQVLEGKNDS